MIVGECITLLVLKKDAGHATHGKGVVVALFLQRSTFQPTEISTLAVESFEDRECPSTSIARFTMQSRIVVADHIYIKEVTHARERYHRMVDIPARAPQIGVLTRKSYEICVVLWPVLRIIFCQCDDSCCTRGVVIGSAVIYVLIGFV